MKLSKKEIKLHKEACALLKKEKLHDDDALFFFENWQEGANHVNSSSGAFFTPQGLARDTAIEFGGFPYNNESNGTAIDLCAGIGVLSWFAVRRGFEVTCVEINQAYYEIGKKLVPEARWICASIFDTIDGHYDLAYSNPPFGNISRPDDKLGGFEFSAIRRASELAGRGVFILPQGSTPFKYSGQRNFEDLREDGREMEKVKRFSEKTGIVFDFNVGIDTSYYIGNWHGVAPICEVCTFDFSEKRGVLF
jgi:16S rRNA G966 N2-methylase RsmD